MLLVRGPYRFSPFASRVFPLPNRLFRTHRRMKDTIHVPYACPKLTPCDVKSFFPSLKHPVGLVTSLRICTKRVCGLQRIEIIAKHYCTHTRTHTSTRMRFFCMRPLLLLYDSVDFSPRACTPGAVTLLLRIYLLENYRGDRCSRRQRRERVREASCTPTTRWFCFFQGWARGHMFKGAKPELREFRYHLPMYNRTVH